jgi:hypothetical protein
LLAAYLDESGIHDGAELCVIAGYFGGTGQWKRFEIAWRKLLRDAAVPMDEFHAKDLLNRVGFFRRSRWNDNQHGEFLNDIADVLSRFKIYPISHGVVVEDFRRFTHAQRRLFTGAVIDNGKLKTSGSPDKPYFMPFQHCIKRIATYAPVGTKVDFYFGLNKPFAEFTTALWKTLKSDWLSHPYRDRMGDASFPLASETPQLQAADFLVHSVYKDMLNRKQNGTFGIGLPPPLLAKCLQRVQGGVKDVCYFDDATMRDLLRQTYEDQGHWDDI